MHGDETGLCRAVIGEIASTKLSKHRSDSNDCASGFRNQHSREKGANGIEVGEEVDAEVALDFLAGQVPDGLTVDNTGIVYENRGNPKLERKSVE